MSEADAWVSAEFQRLAQVINDYDSNLFLEMVPKEHWDDLLDKKKIFRIVDDRTKTIVMYFSALTEPQKILAELWSRDLHHNDVIGRMDKQNAAAEALRMRSWLDEKEAAKDFSAFIVKNTKSRWQHEGRIRDDEFRDLGPVRKVID